MSGLTLESVAADLSIFVPGRRLDDNAQMLLRFGGGARGALWCSQIAPGNENGLRLRVYGTKAGLEWQQEHPNQLRFTRFGEPPRILSRGADALSDQAVHATRIPAGHPEGYLEAFAQLYTDTAALIRARQEGRKADPLAALVPGAEDGARGVAFIEAAVDSSRRDAAWVPVDAGLQNLTG